MTFGYLFFETDVGDSQSAHENCFHFYRTSWNSIDFLFQIRPILEATVGVSGNQAKNSEVPTIVVVKERNHV